MTLELGNSGRDLLTFEGRPVAGKNVAVRTEDLGEFVASWGRRQVQRRQLTGLGIVVCLAIVGPTFWVEETWHGAPLIDRGDLLWLIPSVVMAFGFFLGGVIAGSRRRRVKVALWQGLAVSTATIGLIFVADLYRRHSVGKSLPAIVGEYWIGALLAAGLVSALGAMSGRAWAVKWRYRSRK